MRKIYSYNYFRKRKLPVPDSVFNEVAGLQPATLLQKRP